MVELKVKSNLNELKTRLTQTRYKNINAFLDKYGAIGLDLLEEATPKDTGLTSRSWSYKVENDGNTASLVFTNSNIQNGVNVAFVIQYGHATRRGTYIAGRDYINPAISLVFDKMVKDLHSNGVL